MKYDDVPGWFTVTDQYAFDWVLSYQNKEGVVGDLLELGVYKGKSAIKMGYYLKSDEDFKVCDLFEDASNSKEINTGAASFYKNLTQLEFEKNYLAFHNKLPVIFKGPSSQIQKSIHNNSCRFIHVDASHMYEHVKEDIRNSRNLLIDNGIISFDDYRAEHTPGTAAAVWEAVLNGGLNPIFHTASKLYATFGDPAELQKEIIYKASKTANYKTSEPIYIRDKPIFRMFWVEEK